MIEDFDGLLQSAVTDVFKTMLNLEVRPADLPSPNGDPQLASTVGFIGPISGVVYIYFSLAFARQLTHSLLGLTEEDPADEGMVNDAIGELGNMIVGRLKSRLCDRGLICVLTIPSIVRGSYFSIQSLSSTVRRLNSFQFPQGERLLVETLLKTPED